MQERTKNPRVPEHPLGWMRYALGTLLIVFTLGAGWGITAWLSIDPSSTDSILLTESELPGEEFEESSVESSTEVTPSFDVATTEPVDEYPLDVFDESWAEIDPVAVSQAISASLEQEFQDLESAGIQVTDAFPPREEVAMEPERAASVEPAPAPQVEPVIEEDSPALETETVVEAESPLDALEDFTLPEREPFLEEVVKVEAEPLNAAALDVPEELLHQTVSTGVVSIPAPRQEQKPVVASSQSRQPPAPKRTTTETSEKNASRQRLLKAMSRLEKSLK